MRDDVQYMLAHFQVDLGCRLSLRGAAVVKHLPCGRDAEVIWAFAGAWVAGEARLDAAGERQVESDEGRERQVE
jgi:hypothetical protein